MVVLLTGATGYLGARVLQGLIDEGEDIVAISRYREGMLDHKRVKWLKCDLLNLDRSCLSKYRIDSVVHLAGRPYRVDADTSTYISENIDVTRCLLDAIGRVERFIFASTQAVYGDIDMIGVSEDETCDSSFNSYAMSKIRCETLIRESQARYGGVRISLRLSGFITGGGLVSYIIKQAKAGDDIVLHSKGEVKRDYLPVTSGVQSLLMSRRVNLDHGYYEINVGSGQIMSAKDIASVVCEELGSPSRLICSDQKARQGNLVLDVQKAVELLGFEVPDLRESVRKAVHGEIE